jgi:8-oxo-dGTP diphosphatase
MKLLKYIKDKPLPEKYKRRSAARAIVFDENDQIPILFVSKFNYHKLPGGEIEEGENRKTALDREIKEETGCTAIIEGGVGKITEYRSRWNLFQTSYCYIGKIVSKGDQNLTKKERHQKFKLIWVTLGEAIRLIQRDRPSNYEGKFIRERDLKFLEEAKIQFRK